MYKIGRKDIENKNRNFIREKKRIVQTDYFRKKKKDNKKKYGKNHIFEFHHNDDIEEKYSN